MADPAIAEVERLAQEVCAARSPRARGADHKAVFFYLVRWCQKQGLDDAAAAHERATLRAVSERIARNLDDHGDLVERISAGEPAAVNELRRYLRLSTRRVAGRAGDALADEALSKIALVLTTGTPPSKAAAAVAPIRGPDNEYVFESPFTFWAQKIATNHALDAVAAQAREVPTDPSGFDRPAQAIEAGGQSLHPSLYAAVEALEGLLQAIRALPPMQRNVMIFTLSRRDIDEMARRHMRALAPDLFSEVGEGFDSDDEIAARLGASVGTVRQNRSIARGKLAPRDPHWALLLEVLMPHAAPARRRTPEAHDA